MIHQYSLDEVLSTKERDAAIKSVDAHADLDWKSVALQAVEQVAKQKNTLTTDDVLEVLNRSEATTHEMRALGPVMLSASRNGIITATDIFINCRAVTRHRAPKRVWKSEIFNTGDNT